MISSLLAYIKCLEWSMKELEHLQSWTTQIQSDHIVLQLERAQSPTWNEKVEKHL